MEECEVAMHEMFGGDGEALIASELLAALMWNNYGQDWRPANALVCATAVAPLAAGGSAAAWSVVGGNEQLAVRAVEESGATVRLGRRVLSVGVAPAQTEAAHEYVLRTAPASCGEECEGSEVEEQGFDFVVLACPRGGGVELQWDGPAAAAQRARLKKSYAEVHTTTVWGVLEPAHFGVSETAAELNNLTDILVGSAGAAERPFNSIGRYGGPRDDGACLWKFFSSQPLTDELLAPMFRSFEGSSVIRHSWTSPGAYPLSRPVQRYPKPGDAFHSFVLHEHNSGAVLFPAALEAATSAMEVMAVSARNAALLAVQRWKLHTVRTAPPPRQELRRRLKSDELRAVAPAVPVFTHGEGPCTCIGIPVVIAVPGGLLAFASCRVGVDWASTDGCFVIGPPSPGNATACGRNSPQNLCVVLKRSVTEGRSWSPLSVVESANPGGSIMPVFDAKRQTLVLNVESPMDAEDKPFVDQTSALYSTIASSVGADILTPAAWSAPRRIAKFPGGWAAVPGPNAGVQLPPSSPHAGRLVFAGASNNTGATCSLQSWYSDDGGLTYTAAQGGGPVLRGSCEPGLTLLPDGRILLIGDDGAKFAGGPCPQNTLLHSISDTGGESFGPAHCAVPGEACQASVLAVGDSILVSNPQGPVPRHGMTVSRSVDGAATFEALNLRFDSGGVNGSYAGYSSLVALSSGRVGLAWESADSGKCWGERCRVVFSTFELPPKPRTITVRCLNFSNCTAELQAALDDDSAKHIILPSTGTAVQVDPIFIRKGNRSLTLEPGVELLAISMSPAYQRMDASLLSIMGTENVVLRADGATLRMRQQEYLPPHYKEGEWRATLNIRQVTNLTVVGGTYKDAGGDGIFVESLTGPILITKVTTDHAWRNGLSVIFANGLTVSDSAFLNTAGTAPQCGIDVEPDHSAQPLRGIVFNNVTLAGNARCGFSLAPASLINSSEPIDISIDKMIIRDVPGTVHKGWGQKIDANVGGIGMQLSDSYGVPGRVDVRNLLITSTYAQALYLDNWPSGFVSTSFDGLVIDNVTHGVGETYFYGRQPLAAFGVVSPLVIMPSSCHNSCDMRLRCATTDPTLPAGGIVFRNTTIYDTANRSWLSRMWDGHHGHASPPALANISGHVKVVNAAGCPPANAGGELAVTVDCDKQRESSSAKTDDGVAPSLFVSASPPAEVGRSLPGEDLLDASFVSAVAKDASAQLLVAASSSIERNASRTFLADVNASRWSELRPSPLAGENSVGVCLPATRTGTVCLPSDVAVERDPSLPASVASRAGVLRSYLLVAGASGSASVQPHPALVVDMRNASANISYVDPFRPQAVVSAGSELLMILIGQFNRAIVPPPPPGCRTPPKSTQKVPTTSLVTIASEDDGLHWHYRSTIPLQAPAVASLADSATDNPTCSPACAKGTVCSSASPRECVLAVCKPACKPCEVCDNGRCVPGEVRYVTAYPPVLVGLGAPNGTAGENLWRPRLHALIDQESVNTTLVLTARTGGDANASRHFASADGNGAVWSEVKWNTSSLFDGELGSSSECFAWVNGSTLCAGRRLHRNTSFVANGATPAQALREERLGFLRGGSFRLVNQGTKGKGSVLLVSAADIEVDLSVHNITAGTRQLVDGKPVQFFDAKLLGTPAAVDANGTLVALLAVAWDLELGACLRAQNKLCLSDRTAERHSSEKIGDCANCLAGHMTELVAAGCNDSDAGIFCSTPGPPYPGKQSLVAVASTDGRRWKYISEVPPFAGFDATAPNDGWPLGMGRDPRAPWTCALPALAGDLIAFDGGTLFAAWQPEQLSASPDPGSLSAQAPMCGARSWDGGSTWHATDQLHVRRTSPADGSNQEAPPFAAGGPARMASLGTLGGFAMSDGNCGQGLAADGKPGAGIWLWTASALGLNSTHNATPSLEGTNVALLHNAHVANSKHNEHDFTWQFVNGTDDAAQSSGETDVHLLRSNKTHAELLVVYDRLPDQKHTCLHCRWNGSQTQVWAMRVVVSSEPPALKPCAPKCKTKYKCVHEGTAQPWGQEGKCVPEKACKKACKKPQTCDELTGSCITPPPPPPQPCLGPVAAGFARLSAANMSDADADLLVVWQPYHASKPYQNSVCRATSRSGGRTWTFEHTVNNGKTFFLSSVHSYGVSPRVAFAPVDAAGDTGGGLALMTQGRASALGAGLSLWVTKIWDKDAEFSDSWFNLASLHNDALPSITDTERAFTKGFVDGEVDPEEAGATTDIRVLSSNASHAEIIVLYTKSKGAFLPDWHSHIGFPRKVEQNQTILFSMRLAVSTVPPPTPKPASQLEYLTWYDSYPEEQIELTKPGPNLIWHSGDPAVLHAQATKLGVKALWAFNEYCGAEFRIFNAPYCGGERVYCNPNATKISCPFGKACPRPPSKQCKLPPKKGRPNWLCECPGLETQLAVNWTQHVHNVAALVANLSSIVGLWMGDEPEIGGMSGDSLCAVAATMKQALHRVGRDDIWIYYNDGPDSVRFRLGLCQGLDYFSIDSYDTGAAEAAEVSALYKRALVPKLRGPNKWERRGQGLWFVPGLYASCAGAVVPAPRYPFGNQSLNRTEPTCKGGRLSKTPADIMAKMKAFWGLAQDMPSIKGINPWHWQDRPTMQPATFRRGARTLGPELLALMSEIGKTVRERNATQIV